MIIVEAMVESFKKNRKGIILMCLSSICVCTGQLFWKLSYGSHLLYLLPGFLLYGIGAPIMLYAYRFGSLSVLQPVLSLNYIISLLLAYMVLGEGISLKKYLGCLLIMVGIALIAGGDEH